jgi:hypothetical protein
MAWDRLYHVRPPALQTKSDMNATLLISWWCTAFAVVVILVRVCGRYVRTEKLFREDKIMAASIIPLMIRMALVHVILIWGTNNTVSDALSAIDVQHREIGSKLVLASRIFYAAFIWTAKLTVLEFLKRTIGACWRKSYEIGLQIIRYFLLATFIAVIIATLAECQPFDHYWQVIPDPGPQCRQGLAQLLTMGSCDIITDLLLVVFPAPIVMMSALPMKRKITLVLLLALSLALVAVTAYRVPSTIERGGAQPYRSLLASLEILAAAGVSNSVVIGSFLRDKGVKKPKYRRESTGGASSIERTMTKRTTVTQNHWGSDSDLVGDVGMCLAPELQSRKSSIISAPRCVPPPQDYASEEKGDHAGPSLQGDMSSLSTNSTDVKHELRQIEECSGAISPPVNPRKLNFFDVGNLMQSDEKHSPIHPSNPTATHPHQSSYSHSTNPPLPRNSQPHTHQPPSPGPTIPILSDIGGLLSPTRPSTNLDRSTALPPASRPHHHHHHPPPPSPPPLQPHPSTTSTTTTSPPTSPPLSPRNFSRPGSPYFPPGGGGGDYARNSTTQEQQPSASSSSSSPPPPSYRPRRESELTQWNRRDAAAEDMEIVDAGGLLK